MTDTATTPGATAPDPVQAAVNAAVQSALTAALPQLVQAVVAQVQTPVDTAVAAAEQTAPQAPPQLTPAQDLLVQLNLADTPNQVSIVESWIAANFPTASSPSAVGEPGAVPSTAPAA